MRICYVIRGDIAWERHADILSAYVAYDVAAGVRQ